MTHESSSAVSNKLIQLERKADALWVALVNACKALGSDAPEETARIYEEDAMRYVKQMKGDR